MKFRIFLLLTVMLLTMVMSVPVQASEVNSAANQAMESYSISGRVLLSNGDPISGVTLTLIDQSYMVFLPLVVRNASSSADPAPVFGGIVFPDESIRTAVTDANGYFHFDGLPEGRYRLTPPDNEDSFDPAHRIVMIGPDQTEQNFIQNELVLVTNGGAFTMGCVSDHNGGFPCPNEELPEHSVTLSKFFIDKMEVTNIKYQQCVAAGACDAPGSIQSKTLDWYYDNPNYDFHPVVNVSWYDARDYCSWAGKRLPTEAEWEMAARGSTPRSYPWGDTPPTCTYANYYSDSGFCGLSPEQGDTMPVGSYPAGESPSGVLDMAGNVKEWVSDWYYPYYYDVSPSVNPTGPSTGIERSVRGGSFDLPADYILTASRHKLNPNSKFNNVGFRCVLP